MIAENTKEINPYKLLVDSTFSMDINCNDFFAYACAWSITINSADMEWMKPFIEEYLFDGMYACVAYIANIEPIPPHRNEKFLEVIEKLKELQPEIFTDIDYEEQYNKNGPYRKLCIF